MTAKKIWMYRFSRRLALLLTATVLAGFTFTFWESDDAPARPKVRMDAALQPLWQAAESERNPQRAVVLWESLAQKMQESGKAADTGLTVSAARKMLFTAALKAGQFSKAEAALAPLHGREQIWAKLLLAQAMSKTDSSNAWQWIAKAATQAEALRHPKQRSFTLHAVATAAMQPAIIPLPPAGGARGGCQDSSKAKDLCQQHPLPSPPPQAGEGAKSSKAIFGWEGVDLLRRLLPQIRTAWHRADAMRMLAEAEASTQINTDTFPLQYALQQALRMPMEPTSPREKALLEVHEQALVEDRFLLALDALNGIPDANHQQKKLYDFFRAQLKANDPSRAVSVAERLEDDRRASFAWGNLAVYYARAGFPVRAEAAMARSTQAADATHYADDRKEAQDFAATAAQKVKESLAAFRQRQQKQRATMLKTAPMKEALALVKQDKITESVTLLQATPDARLRAKQFRILAEAQARQTDYFRLLDTEKTPRFLTPEATSGAVRQATVDKLENAINTATNPTDFRTPPASPLGAKIPALPQPDHLQHTAASLREQLPLPTPFSVAHSYFANNFFVYSKFKVALGEATANRSEGIITPQIILLQQGTATLPQLYDGLRAQGLDDYLTKDAETNTYTLRRGLVIGQHASLIIDGAEVSELRQSVQHGAILVNGGKLYISDARLLSWDEENQTSPERSYAQKYEFRPFVAAWSGSQSFISGSEFLNLGYMKSKSFALTFTTGPKKMEMGSLFKPQWPTGVVVDNSFINAYYGFYSYEADRIALVGNEYRNNVIYGIDPHDRSHHLSIAYNTAYDSQEKHGIIISRDVDNSSYIGNLSFDNRGSGFMLDRKSTGTYIYGNTAFANKQDGMTLFESSCSLIASNHFFGNRSAGIRLRNAQDTGLFYNRLNDNHGAGVLGYTSYLEELPSQATRDFVMDPYSNVTAMTLVGNHIEANGSGILAEDLHALTLRGNHFAKQSPKLLQGAWFKRMPYLSSQYDLAGKGVIISETCPKAEWTDYDCRFRTQGIFDGDGQRDLKQRVTAPACRHAQKEQKI